MHHDAVDLDVSALFIVTVLLMDRLFVPAAPGARILFSPVHMMARTFWATMSVPPFSVVRPVMP